MSLRSFHACSVREPALLAGSRPLRRVCAWLSCWGRDHRNPCTVLHGVAEMLVIMSARNQASGITVAATPLDIKRVDKMAVLLVI